MSSAQVQGASAAPSSSPGAVLRAARERRGESVNEAAFAIKLSPRQVTALENDDFNALPGTALVRGFMRNYARYLELDPAPLLAQLPPLASASPVDLAPLRNAEGELPSGSSTRLRTAPIMWIAAALILAVLAGWYFDWFRTEPATTAAEFEVPALEAPAAEGSAAATSDAGLQTGLRPSVLPPLSVLQQAGPDVDAVRSEEELVAAEEARAKLEEDGAEEAAAQSDARLAGEEEAAPATAQAGDAATTASAAPADGKGPAAELAFEFGAESWVEVRDRSGSVLYSGTNALGSTRRIGGEPPFALVVGNAAKVAVRFNGQPIDLAAHIKGSVARLTVE